MKTTSSQGTAFSLLAFTISMTCAMPVPAAQPQSPPASATRMILESNMTDAPDWESSAGNVIQFGDSQSMRHMQERLKDPQQRSELRAEYRAQFVESHLDVGQALDLDAETEEKLIELLTDQQLDQVDRFHQRMDEAAATAREQPRDGRVHAEEADIQTRKIQALRELLGQEKLERYQTFAATLSERTQIAMFDARLAPAHKLQYEQKEKLIPLYREHTTRYLDRSRRESYSANPFGTSFQTLPSKEELRRHSQLQTIAANEQSWRLMPELDRSLRQQAAGILTPPQLATLEQMQTDQANGLRQWIEKERVQAGLIAEIPDRAQVSQPLRTPLVGEVRLRVKLVVNGNEPKTFTHIGNNGEPATFESADDLWLEATPTVFDDDMYELQMAYYEEGSSGRRRIGQMGQMGVVEKERGDSRRPEFHGGGGTVITGSKGYAIEVSALVEPM